MAQLIVKALGLSGLRFVKAESEVGVSKQHSVEPEVHSSSPSDGIQQEISRAEEEAADGSLGTTFDGREENVGKDEEHVEMSANDLGLNEESGREGRSLIWRRKKRKKRKKNMMIKLSAIMKMTGEAEEAHPKKSGEC
ncbi:uncharacterized protein MONOS_17942 [Monocercomonoides exilis]|uniref:uncharacterized protein n=1 Tax=Monocercomonoides exilis TaxID=2049356 RepID=UPI0035593F1C|nr:hypothetical protein MONOS_17942 [Monocercomonoides exilis]